MSDYREIIEYEFQSRKSLNPQYSLRAFARDLGLVASQVSEVLAYKKGLSTEKAIMIAKKIGLNTREANHFISLVQVEHSKKKKTKEKASEYLKVSNKNKKINNSLFSVISDWYYFAILASMQLDNYDGTAKWLSSHLNLDLDKVKNALGVLEELKLVRKTERKYFATENQLETETDFSSMALRLSHKQTLNQAIHSIDDVDIKKRDITSMTMAIDIKKLPAAKRRIERFRKEMCDFLESGQKNAVYNINIQLHPLSHGEKIQ